MEYLGQAGPHFIKGKIEYRLKMPPNEKAKSEGTHEAPNSPETA
jgi:hypothetical protein